MNDRPIIRIRELKAAVELAPTLVTFMPERSIVLIGIGSNKRTLCTARYDLAAMTPMESVGFLARFERQIGASYSICLAFVDDETMEEGGRHIAALSFGDEQFLGGLVVGDRFLEFGESEWLDLDWSSAGVAAAAVAGMPKLMRRSDWMAYFEKEQAPMARPRSVAPVATWPRMMREILNRALISDKPISILTAQLLAELVQDIDARDVALRMLNRASGEAMLAIWTRAFRFAEVTQEPPMLGLIGLAGWQGSQGPLATMALDLLEARPDGKTDIADILKMINEQVVAPSAWEGYLLGLDAREITNG